MNKLKSLPLIKPIASYILQPYQSWLKEKIVQEIKKSTTLTSITDFLPEDVFVVGYPKSGNTWFQNIVTGLVYGLNPKYSSDSLVQNLVPDVHSKKYYKRYNTPMFFKSHHLPDPKYRKVIYLLRDGRDVMVSYLRMKEAFSSAKNIDFKTFIKGEKLFPCPWHFHVENWLSNPYQANMLIIKYEDLKQNTISELNRVCSFLEIDREPDLIKLVAEETVFEKMRQKELKYGWDNPKWPTDKYFIRRGEIGTYQDEMPSDVLEEFLISAKDTLIKCGYSV